MADQIKQNTELRKAIEAARSLANDIATESGATDPMDATYLGLALETVDLRINWLNTQAEAAKEAKKSAKAEPETVPAP